jgi:predicted nucleic acid-binding protein
MPAGRRRRAVEHAYALLLPQLAPLLEVTAAIAEGYARIMADLERHGIILPGNDPRIAATAVAERLTLVTDDHHFAAIAGLETENWLRP